MGRKRLVKTNSKTTKVTKGGGIVIPAEYLRQLGLDVGDSVTLTIDNGCIIIIPRPEAVKKAKALVRKHITTGRLLVKELLDDRRGEVAND